MTADAMAQPEEAFGLYRCDIPEYPAVWVRFKTTGYPFKLRRQFDDSKNDRETMLLVLPRVEAWSVVDAEGVVMPPPDECIAQPDRLDDIEEALLYWLVRVFYDFWRVKLILPRKN